MLKGGTKDSRPHVDVRTQIYGSSLTNEESLIHAEIQQALGGHAALPQKRVYADSAARVRNIMIDYPNPRRNVLHYLRSTSYNIGFQSHLCLLIICGYSSINTFYQMFAILLRVMKYVNILFCNISHRISLDFYTPLLTKFVCFYFKEVGFHHDHKFSPKVK